MVDVDVSKHSGNVRKIDIPLPERGLTQIDSFASKHRETRSSVLAHAARELVVAHAKP
jgi:metal-responsive CopG/Arc/MetJ family transcriptional regulator